MLPVLITNYHILNKNEVEAAKTISFTIGDNIKTFKHINIDNSRLVFEIKN